MPIFLKLTGAFLCLMVCSMIVGYRGGKWVPVVTAFACAACLSMTAFFFTIH